LNDRLADLLMAFPVAQNVARSRPAHINEHHNGLGGPTDPCAIRMRGRADVANGELPEISETLRTVFTQAASYAATVKVSPIDIGRAVLWQVACVYAPVAAVAGFEDAAICYLTTIPAALGLVLPTIRALGEAGEHDYAAGDCDTVVGRTFDNIGFVNGLLHPFGDGWHVLHHLAPGVPQARLGVVMKRVIKMDPAFARYVRRRTGLLTTPRPYA
jgi:fatty acid desaturase